MSKPLDMKRILIFIGFAFGIAWLAGLVLYLTGGLSSPYAFYLVSLGYMGAPALANVLTRLVTREGWGHAWLHPYIKQSWKYWLIAWFAPALLIALGMLAYFLVFPGQYDGSLSSVTRLMEQQAAAYGLETPVIDPRLVLLAQGAQALLIAPLLNALFTFGEEFGWRAYLLQKLLPLGGRKAVLVLGVIWGVWHWPIIAMGHNYGLDYPGAPWLGFLAMTWFTTVLGICMAWAVLKARSVWPAVIIHGAVNGTAGIVMFFMLDNAHPILGPSVAGILGGIGFALAALLIFLSPRALAAPAPEVAAAPVPVEIPPAI